MQSEQIDSLAKALAAAQAQIQVAKRNQENPYGGIRKCLLCMKAVMK